MRVLLPSDDEIRRLYMSGYTVNQIITMFYSGTDKDMKKYVAYYVERAIASYHHWEDEENA